MMKLRNLLFGLAQSTFTDISTGLLVAHVATNLADRRTLIAYIVGVFFALAPDIDVALQLFLKRKADTHHRDTTHRPLVVIAGALCASAFFPFFGLIATFSLLGHFLHDSMGDIEGKWGLKWLWPFSQNNYAFFQTRDHKRQVIVTWTPEKIMQDKALELHDWLEQCYLKICPCSIRAWTFLVFTIGIIAWTW